MRIYLVGFMGCGKSTIGRALAKVINYQFIDLDEAIVKTTNKSINQVFKTYGEEIFREMEFSELCKTFKSDNIIVATGGGCATHNNAMDLINDNGLSIYIELSPKALWQRLLPNKSKRPLIIDFDSVQLLDYITLTLATREVYYKKAKIIYPGLSFKTDDLLKIIDQHMLA